MGRCSGRLALALKRLLTTAYGPQVIRVSICMTSSRVTVQRNIEMPASLPKDVGTSGRKKALPSV